MSYKNCKDLPRMPIVLTKNHVFIAVICIILFASSIFTSYNSIFRYIKYALLPILIAVTFFLVNRLKVNILTLRNLQVYAFLILVNLLTALLFGGVSSRFFEEVILILLPICTAFIITGIKSINKETLITTMFYTYAFSFVLYFSSEFLNISKLFSNIVIALKFSVFPTESWHAFPFGLFSLYFIIQKRKYYAIISTILFVFSFKRISIVAFLIALTVFLWFFAIRKINFNKKKVVGYFMLLNISLLCLLFFFINGSFSRLIYKNTGLNVNHFSQGRFKIYNDTLHHFMGNIWFGSSLGSTHIYIDKKFENVSFLHSDILKVIIEFGIISFIIWLFLFLYLNLTNKKTVPIVLYMNILFLSDNVFIYFDTLLLFYIIISKFNEDVQKI